MLTTTIRPLLLIFSIIAAILWAGGCDDGTARSGSPAAAGPAATASAQAVNMEFDVKGMSCEGCVFAVRSAIAELDGVEACEVSLAEERATVAARDGETEQRIIEAVGKLDFTITRRDSDAAASDTPTDD